MPVQVLIAPCAAGFHLHQDILDQLFARHPEMFDAPHSAAELLGERRHLTPADQASLLANSVVRGDDVHFLDMGVPLRTSTWLLDKLAAEGSASLVARSSQSLKMVEIPEGVNWFVFENDDGSEAVHERHRIWH
jgi:hypothetical protein